MLVVTPYFGNPPAPVITIKNTNESVVDNNISILTPLQPPNIIASTSGANSDFVNKNSNCEENIKSQTDDKKNPLRFSIPHIPEALSDTESVYSVQGHETG